MASITLLQFRLIKVFEIMYKAFTESSEFKSRQALFKRLRILIAKGLSNSEIRSNFGDSIDVEVDSNQLHSTTETVYLDSSTLTDAFLDEARRIVNAKK